VKDFYRELGRLIRNRRKAIPLSQEALGVNVGLSRTSITNIELGRQHLTLHMLYEFASALGVDPHHLLPDKKYLRRKKTLRIDRKHLSAGPAQAVEGLYERMSTRTLPLERSDDASDTKS
jgi:transcriptional regulator with XRE-family HTH domain